MSDVITVLNVKAAILLKGLADRRLHALGKNISSLVIVSAVFLGTFSLIRVFSSYLLYQAQIGLEPLHHFFSLCLFAFFFTVHTAGLVVAYATLYTADEVNFLMGLPIAQGRIFRIRMIENIFASSATLSLLGLAALLGYGSVFRLGWLDYLLTMFIVFVPFVIIAGILAVIVLTVLILLASRFGSGRVLLVVLPLFVAGTLWYMQVADPMGLMRQAMDMSAGKTPAAGGSALFSHWWLPNGWVAGFLQALVSRETASAVGYAASMLVLLAVVFAAATVLGNRWYYRAWLAATELRMRRGRSGGWIRIPWMEFGRPWPIRPHAEAVLKRDFWLFFRDPVQRLHAVIAAILMGAMVFSLQTLDFPLMNPTSRASVFLAVFLFQGFLVSSLMLRFVFPAVSLEGRAFWAVRSAPISLRRLYWLKFVLFFPAMLIPAEILVFAATPALQGPFEVTVLVAIAMSAAVLALVSLNLGAGAYFATLSEQNPVKVASSQGASVTFLGSLIVLLVLAGLLAIPLIRILGAPPGSSTAGLLWLGGGATLCCGGGIALLSNALGIRSLERDF
jgi:ABC-2 type transport system permease protein